MLRMVAAVTAVLVTLLLGAGARAQPGVRVDHRLRTALELGRGPIGAAPPLVVSGLRASPATVVLRRAAVEEDLDALRALDGVWLREVEGRALRRGRLVPAVVTARGLAALAALERVEAVLAPPAPGPVRPLWLTTELVGVGAARRSWVDGRSLDGAGVVIADIDSTVDIFHPDFFRADGGAYDWIDVDGNGRFDPGLDAVDLDGDGRAGEGEVLRVLRARPLDVFGGVVDILVRPEGFSASWDWVYADSDGSGAREQGAAAGADDSTPAYGEPLFVVDDIDGNDRLDPGERLLRLGTSRVRAVYQLDAGRVYRRGTDLLELPDDPGGTGHYGLPPAMHATGVLSIAAGGVPGLGRATTGLAPEAEMVVVFGAGWDLLAATIWALGEGVDVVLHEYAPWVAVALDGSDALSAVVDESTERDGVVHVCPVGNTGGARKHAMATLAGGVPVALPLDVPDHGYRQVNLTFHVPTGAEVSLAVTLPGGERVALDGPGSFRFGGANAALGEEVTGGGTRMIDLWIWGAIPVGRWTFEASAAPEEETVLHAYVQDDVSGWGEGAAFDARVASDQSTIGLPSTARRCLAVGAYAGHVGPVEQWWWWSAEQAGAVRGYSGRGPRIDGLQKPDLIAPDNPVAAFPRWDGEAIAAGAYWVFGGTSGAAPHVAGAALLLVQSGRYETASELAAALTAGAVADVLTGPVPNADAGHGRVSLLEPLGAGTEGLPPTVRLEAPDEAVLDEPVTFRPIVGDPDGDDRALELRWDVGYDGAWDGAFGEVADLTLVPRTLDPLAVRVEVRDGTGLTRRALARVPVVLSASDGDADGDADAGPDADDDGSAEPDDPPGGCGCDLAGRRRPASPWPRLLAGRSFAAQ